MTTMLHLKNVKIKNGKAEANFYPENSTKAGHIVVRIEDGEILSCEDVPGYGESYREHAKQHLLVMEKEKNKATEQTIMWY